VNVFSAFFQSLKKEKRFESEVEVKVLYS